MKKNIILGIIFCLTYYVLTIIFFFFNFIVGTFDIIIEYSELLFNICYIIIPILTLLLPIILKFILKNKFYKCFIYSVFSLLIYIFIMLIIRFSILCYYKVFTIEKWESEHENLRYLMINDLEKKYNFIGMNKNEVYKILGKNYDHDINNCICYFIGYAIFDIDFYCLEYNENNIIIDTKTHF